MQTMTRSFLRFALLTCLLCRAETASAADGKTADAKPVETAAADWSKFVFVSEVQGEIVKVEKNSFLLKIPGPPQNKTTGTGKNRHLIQVPGKPVELSVAFADAGFVRWSKLPTKLDVHGKKTSHTVEEIAELKKPYGVSGYAAERTDLKAGQSVDLVMVRLREIPATKATTTDLVVKKATILGTDPAVKSAVEEPKK